MTFITTVSDEDARGDVEQLYATDRAAFGRLPNFTRAFSHRPGLYAAWRALNAEVKAGMELRRYELATLAAAQQLRSSYCMLAHGSVLAERFVTAEELEAIVADHRAAGLDEVDVAVMDLAAKVAADATSVTQQDVDRLRVLGLSDTELFDVVAAASARCFFSSMLDGLGVEPDAAYRTIDPTLREALTIGRPIAAP